jgi:hypothetical protein
MSVFCTTAPLYILVFTVTNLPTEQMLALEFYDILPANVSTVPPSYLQQVEFLPTASMSTDR